MRVAVVVSDPAQGTIYHPAKFAVSLARKGHEVHAFTWGSGEQAPGLTKSLKEENVHVHLIDCLSRSGVSALLASRRQFHSKIQAIRPQIVHTYGPVSTVQARVGFKSRPRHVAMIEAMGHSSNSQMRVRAGAAMLNRYADDVIALCHYERQRLLQAGVKANKLRVVFNHLDCDDLLEQAKRARLDREQVLADRRLPAGKKLLGCFASFQPRKRQDMLISEFAHVACHYPDWHLVLAGDGAELEACRSLAGDLGVSQRVHFLGRLPTAASFELLACMDAAAHCSNAETFGYSMIEPLLLGIPTVMTRIGIAYEIELANQAVVVSPDRPAELRIGLEKILGHDRQIQLQASSGSSYVRENFHVSVIADQLLKLYAA